MSPFTNEILLSQNERNFLQCVTNEIKFSSKSPSKCLEKIPTVTWPLESETNWVLEKMLFFTSKNVPGGAHQFEGLASRIFIHPAEERFVRKGSALMTVSWITPQVIWLESFTQMISIVRLVLRHYSSSGCCWITADEHTPNEQEIAGSSPGAWLFFISPTFLKSRSVPIMPC